MKSCEITNKLGKNVLTVDEFMSFALYDAELGFYTKNTDIKQHFITAPELSNLFSKVIATWIISRSEDSIKVLELGAGNGTLALDLCKIVSKLGKNLEYFILESSPNLKASQQELLRGFNVTWLDSLDELQGNDYMVVANEFFDALPAKQYKKVDGKYYEQLIDFSDDTPVFINAKEPTELNYKEDFVELYPDLGKYLKPLKNIIKDAVFIDYGDLATTKSLQAIQSNKKVDVFHDITNSDLTTHVDFRQIVKGLGADFEYNVSTLRDYCVANGILNYAEKQQEKGVEVSLQYLLSEEYMGTLFKAVEIKKAL